MFVNLVRLCATLAVAFQIGFKCTTNAVSYEPKMIDHVDVKYPGFVNFIPSANASRTYHMIISAFNGAPFSTDHLFYLPNYRGSSTTRPMIELNNTNVVWPNEATYTEKSILSEQVDKYGGLIVASGFLVPSKENGGIYYYPFASQDRSTVVNQPAIEFSSRAHSNMTWFYHRVRLVDLSGDGKADLLTCRTHKPLVGATKTQLVGYVLDETTLVYEEKLVLNEACDVFFDVADIDSDGRFEIIAAGFFIAKLNIIYSDDPKNSFLTGKVQVKTIDSSGDKFFDVKAADMDGDTSTFELVATNHQGSKDAIKSAMYYYKLNGKDFRTGTWTRTTIYDKFPVIKGGIQAAAPGSARPFYPLAGPPPRNSRPHILVAGDGAEHLYLFEPIDDGGKQATWNLTWSQDFADTVGGISIADINGDGVNELAVAIYEKNVCYVYTMVPK